MSFFNTIYLLDDPGIACITDHTVIKIIGNKISSIYCVNYPALATKLLMLQISIKKPFRKDELYNHSIKLAYANRSSPLNNFTMHIRLRDSVSRVPYRLTTEEIRLVSEIVKDLILNRSVTSPLVQFYSRKVNTHTVSDSYTDPLIQIKSRSIFNKWIK